MFAPYRCRSDVDNQLAVLNHRIRYHFHSEVWTEKYRSMSPLTLKVVDESLKYPVLCQDDVIDLDLAKQARDFAMAIPFDALTPQLNDTDNQPRSEVYTKSTDKDLIRQALDNPSVDPNKWAWENYSGEIWRAIPLTLEDFCGSPIYALLKELEAKWWHYLSDKSLKPLTWVLQRIPYEQSIGAHNDEWNGRRIAFVYYLTPDDWDMDVHGGALCIENCKSDSETTETTETTDTTDTIQIMRICPKFNRLIAWLLKTEKDPSIIGSPVHWVEKVTVPNDLKNHPVGDHSDLLPKGHRISLVGFWCD